MSQLVLDHFDTKKYQQIKNLSKGKHSRMSDGVSVMEAISYIAGEQWSDRPICVCPVIASFLRVWNDTLPDSQRMRVLYTVIPQMVGTRSTTEAETQRIKLVMDWLTGPYIQAWAGVAGVTIGKDLEKAKAITAKRWDEVSSAYRNAAQQMVSEKALAAVTESGLTAAVLAAKSRNWNPDKDKDLLLVQAIALNCARTYAKLTAKLASEALSRDTGGNAGLLQSRSIASSEEWEKFDDFVYEQQKSARKLLRLMAKI